MTATIEERLGVGTDAIREFCEKWGIVELALFGSVVRDDFGPESDIDVMVRYDPAKPEPWKDYFAIKDELEAMFGRRVDLLKRGPIRNPYSRRLIRRDLTVIYAAW
jgi:predicted nucleotidyltransferase